MNHIPPEEISGAHYLFGRPSCQPDADAGC